MAVVLPLVVGAAIVPAMAQATTTTGQITGTFTDSSGQALPGVCASVRNGDSIFRGSSPSDSLGRYSITNLPNGAYHLEVRPCSTESTGRGLVPHWHNGSTGAASESGAKAIAVGAGAVTVNERLATGGSIAGTVRAQTPTGTSPVAGVRVVLIGSVNGVTVVSDAVTASDGTYKADGLRTARYKVRFDSGSHEQTYYPGQSVAEYGTQVSITPTTHRTAVDAVLASARTVTGKVVERVGSTLTPVPNISVQLRDGAGKNLFGSTDANGVYTIRNVPAGLFELVAQDFSSQRYVAVYYGNTTNAIAARRLSVDSSSPATVVAADIETYRPSQMSGTVTDPAGAPAAGVCVTATEYESRQILQAVTAADGVYRFTSLKPLKYRVGFNDCIQGVTEKPQFVSNYYGGVLDSETSVAVALTRSAERTGINGRLQYAGYMTGTVRQGTTTGAPLSGICVTADGPRHGGQLAPSTTTAADGTYRLGPLAPGSFGVRFHDCSGGTRRGWYATSTSTAPFQGGSNPVVVAGNATRTGVNGFLP